MMHLFDNSLIIAWWFHSLDDLIFNDDTVDHSLLVDYPNDE